METSSMVVQGDGRLTSSTVEGYKTPCIIKTFAKSGRQAPHEAFANVGDSDTDWEHFKSQLGALSRDAEEFLQYPKSKMAAQHGRYWYHKMMRDMVRAAWKGDSKPLETLQKTLRIPRRIVMTFTERGLEVQSGDLEGDICLLTLRDCMAGRTGVCENPECGNRFFIKRRSSQKFCDAGACVRFAQQQYALKWWGKHGEQRRQEKRAQAQRKS